MPEHTYPYTNYSDDECSLGCMMHLCRKCGLKLQVVNDNLQLVDRNNFVISSVKISWADACGYDELGNKITSYLISAGTRDKFLVLTNGKSEETVLTIPYAEVAKMTENGTNLSALVKNVVVNGDQLQIQYESGASVNVTVPFSMKSYGDVNEKPLTTYCAGFEVQGNTIVLLDGMNRQIDSLVVHYSERAAADDNGNNIRENYACALQTGTTTLKLIAKSGDLLSEITCPYATESLTDTDGNAFLHDYAESMVIDNDGKRLDLLAHDGTLLSSVRVPWSDLSEHANKAIETAQIVGNEVVFTTYEGTITRLQIPYALKAVADKDNNPIDESYIADVRQDAVTGVISFYAMNGDVLATLVPSSRVAEYDTFDNLIGDYIKTLVFDSQSKYLVATTGRGIASSIRIEYAQSAWSDDIGNIIKNVYIKELTIEEDNEGRWRLISWNGEGSIIGSLILPELTASVGSGLVINQHTIALTNEVKERIYDFDYVSADERLDISTHVLTT